MGIEVNRQARERLVRWRKTRLLSQLELSHKANVSLRTIQNLEGGRRRHFSEATLISLCRALEIPYESLWEAEQQAATEISVNREEKEHPFHSHLTGQDEISATDNADQKRVNTGQEQDKHGKPGKRSRFVPIGLAVAALAGLVAILLLANSKRFPQSTQAGSANSGRIDWISDQERIRIDIITPEWDNWEERIRGTKRLIHFNHIYYDHLIYAGDTLRCELQWSWFYRPPGTPVVYISAYGEWDPDNEVRIFNGTLKNSGTKTAAFNLPPPEKPGSYTIRIFYAEAFAPVPSFYGASPPSQVTAPTTAKYSEITVEVLPKPDKL